MMGLRYHLIGRRGDEGECHGAFVLRPKTRYHEQPVVLQVKVVWLPWLGSFIPFVESMHGDQTSSGLEGCLPSRLLLNALGACPVERRLTP